MTHEPTTEPKTREAGHATPKCSMRWTIDPATGKPVARWTAEQPEKTDSFTLKPAA